MVSYFCEHCDIPAQQSECSVCGKRTSVKSQLYWCHHCNIPIYEEICPLCKEKGTYFTSDARPVFPEERLLLELLSGTPLQFVESSVWNGVGNRYYVNGKKLNTPLTHFIAQDPDKIRQGLMTYSPKNNDFYFQDMIRRWVVANRQHMEYITTEAKQYIIEKSEPFITEKKVGIFVSFSAGKDSTVVSDLVRKALANPSIIHIFGNTTLEFPKTYEYVQRFRSDNKKTPLLTAENKEQDFLNLCETFGPPSRALRWCCTIFTDKSRTC